MLDAEIKTKAEAFALTIYIIGYKSLLPIDLNILDNYEILDNSLKLLNNSFKVLEGYKTLTSFS